MPLYEYECRQCGRRFELIQKFSDPPVEACESCGGAAVRLISTPAIRFKGTGWYVTDYARKSSGEAEGAGNGKEAKAEKTEASSETGQTAQTGQAGDGKPAGDTKPAAKSKSGKAESKRAT